MSNSSVTDDVMCDHNHHLLFVTKIPASFATDFRTTQLFHGELTKLEIFSIYATFLNTDLIMKFLGAFVNFQIWNIIPKNSRLPNFSRHLATVSKESKTYSTFKKIFFFNH